MMAYKPPLELKTRVENIKKKFEGVDSSISDSAGTPFKYSPLRNGKQSQLVSYNNNTSKGKPTSAVQKSGAAIVGSECAKFPGQGSVKAERQLSSVSNKGNIRRSPAFRCDKAVRGRNVDSQSGVSWEKPQSVVNNRVKIFEDEQQGVKSQVRQINLEFSGNKGNNHKFTSLKEISKEQSSSDKVFGSIVPSNIVKTVKSDGVHTRQESKNCLTTQVIDNTLSENNYEGKVESPVDDVSDTSLGYASIIKTLKPVPKPRIGNKSTNKVSREGLFDKHTKCDIVKNKEQEVTTILTPNQSTLCSVSKTGENTVDQDRTLLTVVGEEKENKLKCDDSSNNSDLTNSLKAALKAPLPSGPPPKKPPRTFAHSSPKMQHVSTSIQERIQNLKAVPVITKKEVPPALCVPFGSPKSIASSLKVEGVKHKPVRSKTEPHIMLKKIETVLLNHQQGLGGVVIKPRTPLLNSRKENGMKEISDDHLNSPAGKLGGRSGPLPSLPSESRVVDEASKPSDFKSTNLERNDVVLLGGCLDSLICVSASDPHYIQGHFYEKLNEKQSEFFVRLSSSNEDSSLSENCTLNGARIKSRSDEHIYAEPYAFLSEEEKIERSKKSKFLGLFVDTDDVNDQDHAVTSLEQCQQSESQGLHYLSTPITISPLDRLDALTNCDSKSSDITETVNNNVNVPKSIKLENADKTEIITSVPEFVHEDKIPSRKVPFLRLPLLAKSLHNNNSTDTVNKLDRSKIQLFMNQAFGSPLQGMPITPIDGPSSDSESIASSPDEAYPPVFANEDEGKSSEGVCKAVGTKTANSSDDSCSIASLEQQHQELSKLTEERKVYVRRVSSRIFSSCQRLSSPDAFPHLFHCVMLIGLNLDCEKRVKVPYIKTKYPPHAAVPPLIEHLCFPDAADWPPANFPLGSTSSKSDEQSYSLVITNEAGERKFGYCRRVMPEGANMCLPLAYCIISPFRAKGFYYKVLQELESRHGQPEWLQTAFIKELYACEFPSPGQGLKLPPSSHHGGHTDSLLSCIASQLRRPFDVRLEERDLTQLFSTLSVPVLLQVFGSLLLERKVLFISNSLSNLSSCIEALQSILYPFSWQYTFIPVLPSMKLGVCEAPTPYIIGILKGKDGKVPSITMEDGIAVDLEESRTVQCVGDESTILPARLKRGLKLALQLVASTTEDHEPSRNVLVSEAFIRMFVEVCGHYTTHIVTQQDGKKVFERESFIKAVPSRSIQLFLEWFTETAMFSIFVDSRLRDGAEARGIFEQRAVEHSEEMDKNTMLFLRNYKAINKKVKTFGDRLKDWTPFT